LEKNVVASIYSPEEETKSIWICLELKAGTLTPVSRELLTKGRQLAKEANWTLVGLLLGNKVENLTDEIFAYGANEVWIGSHPLLEEFSIEAYSHATYQAILDGKPSILLFSATPNSRDLAGRLAVRLRTGLNADCTDLRVDTERDMLVAEVTGFGGGILAYLESPHHRPQMATVRPGVFTSDKLESHSSRVIHQVPITLEREHLHTKTIERVVGEGVDLTQAEVLVCGGRGIAGDFASMEQLAEIFSGEVGATRPPVDEGHIERERQIGQTGVIGHPKLAIACGISGAFHFIVGIQDANTVVAINIDPEAPIFEFSDYCIVEDASLILPPLIQALKEKHKVIHD
jgi:electron transfer flavoprotein alpha subunit